MFNVRQSKRLKFTPKMRQNTFGPDPLGSLNTPPYHLAAITGLLLRKKGRVERGEKGEKREEGEVGGKGNEGRGWEQGRQLPNAGSAVFSQTKQFSITTTRRTWHRIENAVKKSPSQQHCRVSTSPVWASV